jgi:hypothetical protein
MAVYKHTDEDLKAAVAASVSVNEVLRRLGVKSLCGNWRTTKRRITRLGLDTTHFLGKAARKARPSVREPKTPLSAILVSGSDYGGGTYRLKQRLLAAGMLKTACACCGLGSTWNGLPLVLALDHINGDRFDNRIDNLRLLCPNCHSQQDTFSGKNAGSYAKRDAAAAAATVEAP